MCPPLRHVEFARHVESDVTPIDYIRHVDRSGMHAEPGGHIGPPLPNDLIGECNHMQKIWRTTEVSPEQLPLDAAGLLALNLHPVANRMLANRELLSREEIEAFFNPSWETGLHDPMLFRQMPEAVARIFSALEKNERIVVHGDYDADGVTGSSVILSTLKEIGSHVGAHAMRTDRHVESYIPHRDKEGYGLNAKTVNLLAEQGTKLVITVDCGIANVEEVALAKSLGMEVIVVDHHQFGETLPDGILIHPRLPGESYPFPHLAAVGVSFKLASALIAEARKRNLAIQDGWEKWLLDFVSIATVTDMVQLVGENRVLETYGLKVLNKTRRPGMQRLIQISGCELGKLDTQSVGFSLGPRINAAGRMDHASLALKLMLAESEEEASVLAAQLEGHNKDRQTATKGMLEEAEAQEADATSPLLVFWNENWSPALVGLVAGKFMERYGKPVIAIGKHGDHWIGSGRSFTGYDITAAVKRAGEGILTRSGGHVQACGFSFDDDSQLQLFVERLVEDARKSLKLEECIPILSIEAELALDEVTWQLVETINRFEPFGEGNRKPIFASKKLKVISSDLMGQTKKHVRCLLGSANGAAMKFVGFNFSDRFELFTPGNFIDVAYDIGINEWQGRKEIQCKLVDVMKTT